jgi:hypothetical protein
MKKKPWLSADEKRAVVADVRHRVRTAEAILNLPARTSSLYDPIGSGIPYEMWCEEAEWGTVPAMADEGTQPVSAAWGQVADGSRGRRLCARALFHIFAYAPGGPL